VFGTSDTEIPLSDVYIPAYGNQWLKEVGGKAWVAELYKAGEELGKKEEVKEARKILEKKIAGWYFHPYGSPNGAEEEYRQGFESMPHVQAEMHSGQNNIIVSEVGYCTPDVYESSTEFPKVKNAKK